jgi:Fe-S cluster assembly protein SufD
MSKVKVQNSKLKLKTQNLSDHVSDKVIKVEAGKREIVLSKSGNYVVELIEAGAEVEIRGVFVTHEKEEVKIKIEIVHKAPHTRANTVLKGAAYDASTIKFAGKIVIEKNCPDTNSFLAERILLLSDAAKAETVPDLEILSDDVKCSHAATISQIPEEELFYLESRGLSEKQAQELIVDGFLGVNESHE